MSAEQSDPKDTGFRDQLPDRYDPVGADLSSFGMGSYEDFQRHLVLPLQSHFQTPMHRDDGGGDLSGASGEPLLHHTLHGQLLNLFLVVAMAIRPCFDKFNLWADTVRNLYR